jgi:two-component system, LuxR family, sensor kinase FixL
MSWITVVWAMSAAACLTLGVVHLLVWCQKRTAWASLLFALMSASVAAMGAIELLEMHAGSPGQLAALYFWYQIPVWTITLSFTGFVLVHLHAGRIWLWWVVCGLRTLALVLNVLTGQNLNYIEITQVRHIRFLGETVSVAAGVLNPWMFIGQLGVLFFVIFVADAAIAVWKRGEHRQALINGGTLVFFVLAAWVHTTLAIFHIIDSPLMTSMFSLPAVAAMAYEMTRDVLRSGELAHDLRESERRFRITFEQAAMGIAHVASNGRFLRVNQRFCDIVGYSHAEMLGRTFTEIMYRDPLAAGPLQADRLLSGEIDSCALEKRFIHRSGELAWVYLTAALVSNQDGEPQWFIAVIEDISDRKQAEGKVRELSHAMENSPVMVVITDLSGSMTYVNRKFSEVTGYSIEECIGRNPRLLNSGESSPEIYQQLWATITGGETWRGEFHNRKKNGELYWESAVISTLLDAGGRATHFVGVKVDITESRRMQIESEQQRQQMAHLSRVATVSELSSSLAHELNQPLAIILTNAQAAQRFLMQQPPDIAEAREILTDIVSEDQRAGEVIRRLRSLLRQGEIQLRPLDLNEIIRTVLQLTRSDLIWQSISVQSCLADDLPLATGDDVQLQQVLLNLVLNACDAMADYPPEDRQLTLMTAHHDGVVTVSVSDTGCGLPLNSDRVFEPFYTTKTKGLGLGLSICSSIVRAHKGRLWGEARGPHDSLSGFSRGATFHLELPARNGRTS